MHVNHTGSSKARTVTIVKIDGIAADRPVSDDLIAGFAMASTGENPSSLYGWTVKRSDSGTEAFVHLHTD